MSLVKRLTLASLTLALLGGCSADQLSVVVLSARAPGDKCDFKDDTLYVSGGSVDMRPVDNGGTVPSVLASYEQIFSWQNNMPGVPLIVNGQTVDTGSGNDFIADEAILSYQYTDGSVAFAGEVQNLRAIIPAGGTHDKSSVGINLIGASAAGVLLANVPTSPQTLITSFFFRGKTASGKPIDTNVASFPLTIYRSEPTLGPLVCPPGQIPAGGVCGIPGRDQDVHCVSST
jgi:hypothetical protein